MRTFVLGLVMLTTPAAAQQAQPEQTTVVKQRGAAMDGKNEISAQLGFQGSLGGTTPAGVRLDFDYARQLTNLVWLDFKINPTFAVGPNRAICQDPNGGLYDCGSGAYGDGYAIDILGGVKLKFPIARVPKLVPYAQIAVGVAAIFARPVHDDGAGLIFHTGGGLRYFVTPHVGLGGELGFTLGPAWYSETCTNCRNGHTEFYRAIDFALGAEFVL
jgi:hypothetical protein